ncbi:MAG: regulatory protein RecX, partial [Paludibacteraceae bacterium]|nr:regulatory protein RecX [Paludibacteraceae bacterium]
SAAERCRADVEEKLRKAEASEEEKGAILDRLVAEGFIDERRYAKAFAADKFRFSKWGKHKIEFALRAKRVSEDCIGEAIDAIDPDEYERTRQELTEAKAKTLKGDKSSMENRAKILRFMAGRGFILLMLVLINVGLVKADGLITGREPDYAGRKLVLTYETDGITHTKATVDSCMVDSAGNFRLDTRIETTQKCLIDLGYYKGVLYVEPYKIYNVNLPPYRELTKQELSNPYFSPKEVLLSLINPAPDDLNIKITAFDDSFDVALNRLIRSEITPERIENEFFELEYKFGDKSPFFTTYRYCSYAILVNLYGPTQPDTAIDAFFINEPVAYNNPAYWEAFSVLFEQYKNVTKLASNKPLEELVIIHHVLAGAIPEEALNNIQTPENKPIAERIRKLKSIGAVGTYTLTTSVKNIDGKTLDLKDFESPQIFIIFANSMLGKSQSDLDFAVQRTEKWRGKCAVLVVFLDSDAENIYRLTQKLKSRDNILFSTENSEFIKAFGVKNAPAYFRIDADGKILESPAASPENFNINL